MKLKLTAVTISVALFVSYVFTFDTFTYQKPYVNAIVVGDFLTYWMPIICSSCLVLQFCTFAVLLIERFEWVNDQLKKLTFLCSKHGLIKKKLGIPFSISQ